MQSPQTWTVRLPLPTAAQRNRILFFLLTSILVIWGLNEVRLWPDGRPAIVAAQTCVDNDGDGYGNPADGACTFPELDCNDGNSAVNPGATEICNGIDDNCDGNIDESFPEQVEELVPGVPGSCVAVSSGPLGLDSCSVGDEGGCCVTPGTYVCAGGALSCPLPDGVQPDLWEEESPAAGTCFDFNDNNCDGLADHEQAVCQTGEFCNAFDDDNDGEIDEDFTDLGDSCTVGIGLCERSGAKICSNDDLGTMCSVSPGAPLAEGPPGSLSCSDGLDNDCDGTVDLADASCQLEAEICDGLDNTGEGDVDEAFPDLGSSCMVGVGACQASGAFVCSANGADTMCSATPGLSSVEGPTGPTCNDGIDNDCDGLTDAADDNCAADQLVVNCALPYLHSPNPPNGDSCEAWHTIQYSTNASPDALVTAELVALDADGNVLASLPVQNGDEANLKSRIKNLQAMTKGNRHWLTGPVPLLRVMVDDNGIQRSAYCSNIPYLEVMKPAGEVVSESEGDYTEIEVALPLVDPTTLSLKIDGIDDIISQLGLNPATDFPGGPYSGNVNIHGEVVQITQLSVLSAPAADPLPTGVPAANTLRMVLSGLGCGEHIVVVDGERRVGIFPNFPPAPVCLVDDLTDKGTSVGFAVAVDSPFPGEVTFTIPTPVTGEVCHGREIVDVNVNGKVLDTASQIFTPGDGEDSGDLFTYIIDTTLPQTDLAAAIATGQSSGTFDPGSNRLVVGATDDLGTRAFENLIFTIGDTIAPGQPLSSSLPGGKIGEPIFLPLIVKRLTPMPGEEIAARQTIHLASWAMPADLQDPSLKLMADEVVYKAVRTKAQRIAEEATRESLAGAIPLLAEDEVSDALVAGLEQPALQTFFNQFCADATDDIEMKMREGMINKEFPGEKADVPLACDPTVHTDITDVSFNGDVACEVGLADGQVEVNVVLPEIEMDIDAHGSCKDTFLGVCVSEVIIDVEADALLTGMSVLFPITRDQFLTGGETTASVTPGVATVEVVDDTGTEVNCLSGVVISVLDFLADVFEFIVTVLTLGFVNPDWDVEVELTGWVKEIDITAKVGIKEVKADVPAISFERDPITAAGLNISTDIDDISITPAGLAALFKATFAPTVDDPEILDTEGAVLTPAPPPLPPQGAANESLYVSIADDTFNQLFASMTAQGMFKTIALSQTMPDGEPMTFGDLLPEDCNSLDNDDAIGRCHGIKGTDCGSLPVGQRLSCNVWQTLLENRNISVDQPLLMFAREDIPPNLLLQDDPVTENEVEAFLRLNDLYVAVLLERDGSEGVDTADLTGIPSCLSTQTQSNVDCKLLAACMDLNIEAKLVLDNSGDEPAFDLQVVGVKLPEEEGTEIGQECEGGLDIPGGRELELDEIATRNPIDDIEDDADSLTPDIGSDGVGLGGNIEFVNPRLLGVETGGDPNFDDYLMIIGEVGEP